MTHHHPIEKLVFEDGKLFELLTPAGTHRNSYMDTPEISVTAKAGYSESGGDTFKYGFKLTRHTCNVWRAIYASLLRDFPVEFNGDTMQFLATPASLPDRYSRAKETIRQTNEKYTAERSRVILLVQQKQVEQAASNQKIQAAKDSAKTGFESLEL